MKVRSLIHIRKLKEKLKESLWLKTQSKLAWHHSQDRRQQCHHQKMCRYWKRESIRKYQMELKKRNRVKKRLRKKLKMKKKRRRYKVSKVIYVLNCRNRCRKAQIAVKIRKNHRQKLRRKGRDIARMKFRIDKTKCLTFFTSMETKRRYLQCPIITTLQLHHPHWRRCHLLRSHLRSWRSYQRRKLSQTSRTKSNRHPLKT